MNIHYSPTSIAIADSNNDKWLDLVVTNQGTGDLGILYGYDYATFDLRQTYFTGYESFPRFVAVGDFNNDRRMDIAIADSGTNDILLLFGFGNEISYSMSYDSNPYSLTVGDFNNDSWIDIAVANYGADYVEILLNEC